MKIIYLFLVLHLISSYGYSQINNAIVKPKYKIIRVEEMGEDFSVLSIEKLFEILNQSEDKIELRKAAQALGDKHMLKPVKMNQHFNNILYRKVNEYLNLFSSRIPNEPSEAKSQIFRLWHLAIPPLLSHLESKNYSYAAQCLIEMKNEKIIDMIISKSKNTKDSKIRDRYNNMLRMMQNEYRINVLRRVPLTKAEIDTIYQKKVAPYLAKINFRQN